MKVEIRRLKSEKREFMEREAGRPKKLIRKTKVQNDVYNKNQPTPETSRCNWNVVKLMIRYTTVELNVLKLSTNEK